jgi:hypothetical protein
MLRPRGMTLLPRLSLSLLLEKAPKTNYPWLGSRIGSWPSEAVVTTLKRLAKSLCDGLLSHATQAWSGLRPRKLIVID